MASQTLHLGAYQTFVDQALSDFAQKQAVQRFWEKDGSLWKNDQETITFIPQFMGWIDCASKMKADHLAEIQAFADQIRADGYTHAILAGMGGSSLAPLVFEKLFPTTFLNLVVADSTHPTDLLESLTKVDLAKTVVVVASKSGTTAEPNAFNDFYFAKLQEIHGEQAARSMVVITDPGSKMQEMAEGRGYRKVFLNYPDIGGRYSALSLFGLVPAALKGINIGELLDQAEAFGNQHLNGGPGFDLGVALGTLALKGRDKLTFVTEPELATLGLWMEQLVAESTGKDAKGILPIATERLSEPSSYSIDRVFAAISVGPISEGLNAKLHALEKEGHPVIRVQLESVDELGAEMLRWEFATAAASVVLGINPFDQPNVQEAKDITKQYIQAVRSTGKVPEQPLAGLGENYALYGNYKDVASFIRSIQPGDYFAILAYTASDDAVIEKTLQDFRHEVGQTLKVATTLGYGPRYLHSTGQFHKGGPNTGVFLVVTHQPQPLDLPGEDFGFDAFVQAQALGDFDTLGRHNRRALRVQISDADGLKNLKFDIEKALGIDA